MREANNIPHVLLVSFPGQGHINPLLRFAKRIASKGLLVTFTSTHDIGHRIFASSSKTPLVPDATNTVGKGLLRFEFFSDGMDIHDPQRGADLDLLMLNLRNYGGPAFADLVRRQADEGRPVSCIVNNPFLPWALDVAEELRIPSAVLWVQSCAVFSAYFHYFHRTVEFPNDYGSDVTVNLPGLPELRADNIPSFLLDSSPYKSLKELILSQFRNIEKATWVFANTFDELEPDAIRNLSSSSSSSSSSSPRAAPCIIPVGPLVDIDSSDEVKGDLWKAADCMGWLDEQKPLSVVYVSVGSIVVLTIDEIAEIAYGLRNTGRPFLWVLRENFQHLLPEGFLEEVKDRGMVVGWSPQDKVLGHVSTACFVTHCGWNSTLELITAGVPVIAYPQWGDQVTDAKFLVEVYGVGVRMKAPVERGELATCVEEVMDSGEKAEGIRKSCSELKEAAARAVAEGGSSDRNVQAFVDEIWRRNSGSAD